MFLFLLVNCLYASCYFLFLFVSVQWHIATMTSWSSISWCILLYAIIKQVAQTYGFSARSAASGIHPFTPTRFHFESLSRSFIPNQNHPATRGILVHSHPLQHSLKNCYSSKVATLFQRGAKCTHLKFTVLIPLPVNISHKLHVNLTNTIFWLINELIVISR